ncbi:MAG: hypothetical protein EOP73_32005, partial [Variovorax sp.]
QLRPLDASEYGGRLDATQLARLQAVFPGGVCDWSKPGVGQQAASCVASSRPPYSLASSGRSWHFRMFSDSGPPATWRGEDDAFRNGSASHAAASVTRVDCATSLDSRQKFCAPAGRAARTLSSMPRPLVSALIVVSH